MTFAVEIFITTQPSTGNEWTVAEGKQEIESWNGWEEDNKREIKGMLHKSL